MAWCEIDTHFGIESQTTERDGNANRRRARRCSKWPYGRNRALTRGCRGRQSGGGRGEACFITGFRHVMVAQANATWIWACVLNRDEDFGPREEVAEQAAAVSPRDQLRRCGKPDRVADN